MTDARQLIALAAAALFVSVPAAAPPVAPITIRPVTATVHDSVLALREQTADQQALHALNRLGFGPRPGDLVRVRAMGVDNWIDSQLHPESISDRPGDSLVMRYPVLGLSLPALYKRYPPPRVVMQRNGKGATLSAADSTALRDRAKQARRDIEGMGGALQSMRVARAVVSERQLQEVMVDFWENHFNVYGRKGQYMPHWLVAFDRDVIRPHALGHFRDLLGAVAHSPAMLYYLDNVQSRAESTRRARPDAPSRKRGLNENYARELLELHTLGVDGGYTQKDVVEVARAFTGWTVAPVSAGGDFVFRRAAHDDEAKTVLGTQLRAGRGEKDGEAVLDILARNPATAHHIATELSRRLVSDEPPEVLVERAAQTFLQTDGDIREVVRTIVTSPEFFSTAAYRAKVKSPFETVVSALRALGAVADTTSRTARVIASLGQPLFGHLTPDGYPETGESWMNSGAILGRINFGLSLAGGGIPGVSVSDWPGSRELATAPREAQVDGVIRALLGGDASPDTRAFLLAGENPLSALSSSDSTAASRMDVARIDDAMTPPSLQSRRRRGARTRANTPLTSLELMVGLALGSPEFQHR